MQNTFIIIHASLLHVITAIDVLHKRCVKACAQNIFYKSVLLEECSTRMVLQQCPATARVFYESLLQECPLNFHYWSVEEIYMQTSKKDLSFGDVGTVRFHWSSNSFHIAKAQLSQLACNVCSLGSFIAILPVNSWYVLAFDRTFLKWTLILASGSHWMLDGSCVQHCPTEGWAIASRWGSRSPRLGVARHDTHGAIRTAAASFDSLRSLPLGPGHQGRQMIHRQYLGVVTVHMSSRPAFCSACDECSKS